MLIKPIISYCTKNEQLASAFDTKQKENAKVILNELKLDIDILFN